jgi:hypothetical protein
MVEEHEEKLQGGHHKIIQEVDNLEVKSKIKDRNKMFNDILFKINVNEEQTQTNITGEQAKRKD